MVHFTFHCLILYSGSNSAPSTPSKGRVTIKKFVKTQKVSAAISADQRVGAMINRRRPAAIIEILGKRHALGADADSEYCSSLIIQVQCNSYDWTVPVWDVTAHFSRTAAAGSFDLEIVDRLGQRLHEDPAPASFVAVFHTVSTYPGSDGSINLSLNVVGTAVLLSPPDTWVDVYVSSPSRTVICTIAMSTCPMPYYYSCNMQYMILCSTLIAISVIANKWICQILIYLSLLQQLQVIE